MNLLFGTQFPVMEAQKGRQQTTKGVWMGLSRTQSTLLIFDVEGTDSRERGDSHAVIYKNLIFLFFSLLNRNFQLNFT